VDTESYISSGIIEAYVVGLSSEEEVQILKCIQEHNPEVRQAVSDAQESMEKVVTDQAVTPPAHLKGTIWDVIQEEDEGNEKQEETIEKDINKTTTPSRPIHQLQSERNNRYKTWAIAASILFLIGLGTTLFFIQRQGNLQQQIAQLEQNENEQQRNYTQLAEK